jgi:hypothetical protein
MDRYRRRIAMLSVGAQLGCPVRRRALRVRSRSRRLWRSCSRPPEAITRPGSLQPGAPAVRGEPSGHDGVPRHATNGGTVPQLQPPPGIATVPGSSLRKALDAYATNCCHAQPVRAARDALAESQSPSPVLPLGPDGNRTIERDLRVLTLTRRCAGVGAQPG